MCDGSEKECLNHCGRYTGSIPCTGRYACLYCNADLLPHTGIAMDPPVQVINWPDENRGPEKYIVSISKNGIMPLKQVTGLNPVLIGALLTIYQNGRRF
jgi:hypothetical protein